MALSTRLPRFIGTGLTLAAIAMAGCGTPAAPGIAARPSVALVQQEALDMRETSGGRFDVVFQGLRTGYKVQATRADIAKVRIVLTSPRLIEPMVKTVSEAELNQIVVTVPFTNVPAGDVGVKVQALDKDDRVIGAKESASNVAVGQTTVLQMAVKLDAVTGNGNLATTITFEDPSPAPSIPLTPTPGPSATPTPTPVPTATPVVVLERSRLVRHLFGNPEVEVVLKNPTDAEAKARVYMYFYNDNTLKDSQAREIPLSANQQMTFRVKSTSYFVNKVSVVIK